MDVPERITKKSSTIDPARNIKAGRPSAGSVVHISESAELAVQMWVIYSRPGMVIVFGGEAGRGM